MSARSWRDRRDRVHGIGRRIGRLTAEFAAALGPAPRPTAAILVLGMHRSGTSALTRIVNLVGVPVGQEDDLVAPDQANARGYWESFSLSNFQDSLLARRGGSWGEPPSLPSGWERDPRLLLELGQGRRIVRRIYAGQLVWVWKDPRTSLTLPFWQRALSTRILALIIHRNPLEVAYSLIARDGVPIQQALALWEHYNRALLANTAGLPAFVTSYETLIDNPVGVARSIGAFLSQHGVPILEVPDDDVNLFVDRKLRHAAVSEEDYRRNTNVTESQRELSKLLRSLEGAHSKLKVVLTDPADRGPCPARDLEL